MGIGDIINFVLFKSFSWKYEFLGVVVIVIVITYIKHKLSFWSKQNIPYEIIIGNYFWSSNSPDQIDLTNVKKFGKIFGTYKFLTPVLCVSDINLIEKILVTNFHNFFEQRTWLLESQILRNSLFAADYSQWKRQKQIISSAFNSRKLKLLQPIVQKSSKNLVKCLNLICDSDLPFNVSEYFSCYALYSMLSAVFDIDVEEEFFNNHTHPFIASYNAFNAKKAHLSQGICSVHPFIAKGINLYFLNSGSIRMLKSILDNAIKMRQSKQSECFKNFIDILTKSSDDTENEDEDDLCQQLSLQELKDNLIAVFIAATEAIGKTISRCIYYMALNSDIQDKLCKEIVQNISAEENICWDSLRQLPYTEAFIKETLRFSTPFGRYERVVKRDLSLNTKLYGDILLPKNSIVSVLASAVHMDSDYFADPYAFNPNRFLHENKHLLLQSNAFIPFAIGYRKCIGMKYAFYHIKHCLAYLLLNFKFEVFDSNNDVIDKNSHNDKEMLYKNKYNVSIDKLMVKIKKL